MSRKVIPISKALQLLRFPAGLSGACTCARLLDSSISVLVECIEDGLRYPKERKVQKQMLHIPHGG